MFPWLVWKTAYKSPLPCGIPLLGLAMVVSCAFPSGWPTGFAEVAVGCFFCEALVSALDASLQPARARMASKGRMIRMLRLLLGESREPERMPQRPPPEKRGGALDRPDQEKVSGSPASSAALAAACSASFLVRPEPRPSVTPWNCTSTSNVRACCGPGASSTW